MSAIDDVQRRLAGLLPETLGMQFTLVTPSRIEASVQVRREICTAGEIMHGGAIMAVADTVGAVGAVQNLRAGQGTTTLESKTNFFAAARLGTTVTATSEPLHLGRRTMVWQTTLTLPDGRRVAQVTQTQMVLDAT